MENLIRQFEDWEEASPESILAWMSETTTELRSVRKNANELMILLGTKVANGLTSALNAAGLPLIPMALATPDGIDFGHPETQSALDELGKIDQFKPFVATLKAIGQDIRTRWARTYGDVDLPTVEQVEEAVELAKVNDAKMLVREWRNTVLLQAVDTAINEGQTVDQIKEVIAKL